MWARLARSESSETAITYRTLLVHVDDDEACLRRIEPACRLAQAMDARLVGAYLVPTPALAPSISALLPEALVTERLRETGEAQAAAEQRFRAAVAALGPRAEWRAPAGDPARAIAIHAREADLVVIGQPDPASTGAGFATTLANAAILGAGRPVLVIPYIGVDGSLGENVMVALDAGRSSARAVTDALPLLHRAQKVVVLSISAAADETVDDVQARGHVVAHLSAHGIDARTHHLDLPDVPVGEMLLSQAADLGADLIVMGAYGHTRFHEVVLGGVTRTLLETMTVPVLMAH